MGEYDPVDAALADLETHYAREHPELAGDGDGDEEGVSTGGHTLAA